MIVPATVHWQELQHAEQRTPWSLEPAEWVGRCHLAASCKSHLSRFSVMLLRPRKPRLHAAAGLLSLSPETPGWAWGLAEANCRALDLGGLGASFSLSWSSGPRSTNPMVPQFPHLWSKYTPLSPKACSPIMRSRMKKYFSFERKYCQECLICILLTAPGLPGFPPCPRE